MKELKTLKDLHNQLEQLSEQGNPTFKHTNNPNNEDSLTFVYAEQ